jgi:hypothetical protein
VKASCYQCRCCGDGLEGGQDLRLCRVALGLFAEEFVEEAAGVAAGREFFDGGFVRERTEGGVFDDLLHVDVDCLGRGFGEVEGGDLETVEQQAGAALIEVVGGDALEDLGEGELDAGAVGELGDAREGEGAEAGLAGRGVLDGAARGVVEVAEGLVAQAGRAAAATVGVDVTALIGVFFRIVSTIVHDYPLPVKRGKILIKMGLGPDTPWGVTTAKRFKKESPQVRGFELPTC